MLDTFTLKSLQGSGLSVHTGSDTESYHHHPDTELLSFDLNPKTTCCYYFSVNFSSIRRFCARARRELAGLMG